MERPTPDGDLAARATQIARSECGNYGEDALTAWKLTDGPVVIERVRKDGGAQRWRIEPGDTLRVTARVWGSGAMLGIESELTLVTSDDEERELSHFEFSFAWGGPHDDDVAKLAGAIGSAAGCTVTVIPTVYPPDAHEPPAPTAEPPPPAPPAPPPPPPTLLVGELLASLVCGDGSDELLRALALPDGRVVIENATTGVHWTISRDDVLVLTPFVVPSGSEGVWTCLERGKDRIADCSWRVDDHRGADEAAVAAFVAKVIEATGCTVDHRSLVWP